MKKVGNLVIMNAQDYAEMKFEIDRLESIKLATETGLKARDNEIRRLRSEVTISKKEISRLINELSNTKLTNTVTNRNVNYLGNMDDIDI